MELEHTVLHFHMAAIYSNGKQNKDKVKVRIIPDLLDVNPKDLPSFPMWNPTELIHGLSEEESGDAGSAERVWVVCTDDYQFGFVLGVAGTSSGPFLEKNSLTWPYSLFKTHAKRMGTNGNALLYKDLCVLYTNVHSMTRAYAAGKAEAKMQYATSGTPAAFILDVVNWKTGDRWIMHQSGTCIYFGQSSLVLRVGSPGKQHSTITQTCDTITIKAKNVVLDGEHTSLGKHGMKACAMQGVIPIAKDGMSIVPLYDVTF